MTKKKILSAFGGAVVAAGLTIGAFAHDAKHPETKPADAAPAGEAKPTTGEAQPTTIEGELIDSACYVAAEGEAKGKDHAACATKCLGSGVPAAILPAGSKDPRAALFLLTNPVPLAAYAAQTIKVEGTMAGDFQAFDVKRLYVKEGHGWKEVRLQDEHHKMSGGDHGHGHAPSTKPAAGHHQH